MKQIVVIISLAITACGGGYIRPLHQGMFEANCNRHQLQCSRQIMHTCPDGFVPLNKSGTIFMCEDFGQ